MKQSKTIKNKFHNVFNILLNIYQLLNVIIDSLIPKRGNRYDKHIFNTLI